MSLILRQQKTLELVRERGYISIEELAQYFDVTPQTIRRDINHLADEGLLRRYHGGAAHDSTVENTEYTTRVGYMLEEKRTIAAAVAAAVPDHASLFINIGTTTEAIAHALLNHTGLKIITNNLNVAKILSNKEDFEVLIASGRVRPDGGVIGQATADFFKQFNKYVSKYRFKIEQVFGLLKKDFGFSRFRYIGIDKVEAESTLISIAFNLKKASFMMN